MRLRLLLGCALGLACGGREMTGGGVGETDGTDSDSAHQTSSGAADETDAGSTMPDPDLPPPIECGPDAAGPYWVLEGEQVEVPVSCSTDLVLPGADFEFESLPPGAVYDPTDATLRWTPSIAQAAVYELAITAVPYDEVGTVKIGVADDFNHPDNVPVVDPTQYTEEYGLPVLFLDATPALNNDFYTPATITHRGHVYTAEAKHRGASSLGYPKKSYTLKFTKEDKFSDPGAIGGFLEKRKIVLTTTFDDNTYIRQRLSYEVWNRLDPGHIQVQAYNGVVFVDGEYWGMYLFCDHVDGYLMEDHELLQDGNLFKARTHDANFRLTQHDGDPKVTLHDGLSKSEGLPLDGEPGAFDDLDELIQFVATAPSVEFLAEIDARIDRRDYEDWWIAVSAISATDSGGKNSYHYHNPGGGLWRMVPWDFNHSFGQNWRTLRMGPDEPPEDYTGRNELFTRFLAEPSIGPPLRERYGLVLDNELAVVDLLDLVDAWTTENYPSALRDQSKWGDDYLTYSGWDGRTDFLDHDGEVEYMQQWMVDRWAYLQDLY